MSDNEEAPTLDLDTLRLSAGAHAGPAEGACVMELASYLACEPWSDRPACVSPVIAAFLRAWNDSLDDETRQRLTPYAARVIGTNTGPADDEVRAWLAADWLARIHTPAWLRLVGLDEHARALEGLARLADAATATAAQPTLGAARQASAAAWDDAWDDAWDAAWAAAGAAARDAAWAAASSPAGDAAWDAAWAAARAAAGDALAPTVLALQASAFVLLDAMIAVGRVEARHG